MQWRTQRSCPGCGRAACGCSLHASPGTPRAPFPGRRRAAACPPSHALPPGMLRDTQANLDICNIPACKATSSFSTPGQRYVSTSLAVCFEALSRKNDSGVYMPKTMATALTTTQDNMCMDQLRCVRHM